MNPANGRKNNTRIQAQVEDGSFLSKKMIVIANIIFKIKKYGMNESAINREFNLISPTLFLLFIIAHLNVGKKF